MCASARRMATRTVVRFGKPRDLVFGNGAWYLAVRRGWAMPMILVVDDTEVDRRLIGGLLEKDIDWLVNYASDGYDALGIIDSAPPDVVVTDLSMPRVDGMQLVIACREKYPRVPVILVTGQGSETLAMQALRQGAASYVPKSHLADTLLETVEQVLAMRSAERSHDRLIECTTNTRYKFQLDNDPSLIAPLVDRVQRVMIGMKLCSIGERMHLGVALEEALLNALYHGNLQLPTQDLPAVRLSLRETGRSEVIDARRREQPYADRRILVGVDLTHDRAQFVIRDYGQGFATATLPPAESPDGIARDAGRGLVLIRAFMDEVTFNESGTEIRMVWERNSARRRSTAD